MCNVGLKLANTCWQLINPQFFFGNFKKSLKTNLLLDVFINMSLDQVIARFLSTSHRISIYCTELLNFYVSSTGMVGVQKLSERCLKGIWKVSGRCFESVQKMSGTLPVLTRPTELNPSNSSLPNQPKKISVLIKIWDLKNCCYQKIFQDLNSLGPKIFQESISGPKFFGNQNVSVTKVS